MRRKPSDEPRELPAPLTISFRLNPDAGQVLDYRAGQLGCSPHELARHYLLEALQAPEERAALREAVTRLDQAVNRLRGDFDFAVEALLASAGKVSPEAARKWVEASFKAE